MKVKRAKSTYVLMVGMLTLISAGGFLAYSLYSALTKSQITKEQQLDIRPLNGSLNQMVLENLSKRRQFNQAELSNVVSIDYSQAEKETGKTATFSAIVEAESVATESATGE